MTGWEKIKVSSKILGHVSAGVYRSPGGAIKELVSNAFDADATRVSITTNWPSFDIITCYDNGIGIEQEKFERMMSGEIGDSSKRVTTDGDANDVTAQGRPVIGWLGIGMLGIAQICYEFKVISHHKATRTAFSASIRLADFLREKVTDVAPKRDTIRSIDVGEYTIEGIEYDQDRAGTYVIASEMRATFVKKFRESSGNDPLPSRFSDFLKKIHRARSVKVLSDYWQMVWELAVACPIPYEDEGPFDWDRIEAAPDLKEWATHLQKSLTNYQFEVVVDGLSLRRPNRYPLASPQIPKREPTTGMLYYINEGSKVYDRPFKLSGYIYSQRSRAVEPMELRGLLVRIRNIAIGIYDPTLLKYPKVPAPRFYWLSGEIFVEEGLEFSLNIDRDGFNEIHPHYVKLREIIHHLLKTKVFPESDKNQRELSQKIREEKDIIKKHDLDTFIRQELGGDYLISSSNDRPFPVIIDENENVILENHQSKFLPKAKNKRELIKLIAHAFEISMLVPEEERREEFYRVLSKFAELGLL